MDPRLITAFVVVVGVPAVLFGYIYATEIVLRIVPGASARPGPAVAVAVPGARVSVRLPGLPDDRDGHP